MTPFETQATPHVVPTPRLKTATLTSGFVAAVMAHIWERSWMWSYLMCLFISLLVFSKKKKKKIVFVIFWGKVKCRWGTITRHADTCPTSIFHFTLLSCSSAHTRPTVPPVLFMSPWETEREETKSSPHSAEGRVQSTDPWRMCVGCAQKRWPRRLRRRLLPSRLDLSLNSPDSHNNPKKMYDC